MLNLYVLNEVFTNGFSYYWLNIMAFLSVGCGLFVIISKNPIVSVLFLIGLFLSIAGYLMLIGINFIGLSYLLVYVGAVSILFLFILMLINVRISELVTDNSNSVPLAVMIGVIFNLVLYNVIPSNYTYYFDLEKFSVISNISSITNNTGIYEIRNSFISQNSDLQFVSSQVWDSVLSETSHITTIGNVLYTVYPLWLILTSIILLLAMVGAIIITIKQ